MEKENRTFRNTWHKNIKKNNAQNINKKSIYKPILKIIFLLLLIFSTLIIYKWSKKIPDIELLDINKSAYQYQPDTLLSPKLLIQNKSNEPITIEALLAKKSAKDSNIIILEAPKGHYKLSNKRNIYFYSIKGILNSNEGTLKLIENVEIKSSDGTELFTDNMIYNYKNNIINSKDPVTLDGKWGILKGKGFSYDLKSSIINLIGNPKLSLYNNRGIVK